MTVIHPKSKSELDKLIASAGQRLVVIDFFATWCGPCRLMGPKFNKLAEELQEPLYIGIDVDEQEDIAAIYDVNVMPTFVFFKNGKKFQTIEGNNYDELRKIVETHK